VNSVMKLTVGMGSVDDYPLYVSAGADEVFIGAVPEQWQSSFGPYCPINRREVCYYNVQAGPMSELEILADSMMRLGVPVTITLNSLSYTDRQRELLAGFILSCLEHGFERYIIADPGFLWYLKTIGLMEKIHVHLSGEYGAVNRYVLQDAAGLGVDRVIFHRDVSLADMERLCSCQSAIQEYEAFLLNERCHFTGAWCNSLHCDELPPLCRVPYRLMTDSYEEKGRISVLSLNNVALTVSAPKTVTYIPGESGCGLCALWRLRDAGITHLKLVGRGAHTEDMLRDIRACKQALYILGQSQDEEQYLKEMKATIFPEACSGCCYYSIPVLDNQS